MTPNKALQTLTKSGTVEFTAHTQDKIDNQSGQRICVLFCVRSIGGSAPIPDDDLIGTASWIGADGRYCPGIAIITSHKIGAVWEASFVN